MSELLPCPFCGDEGKDLCSREDLYVIGCDNSLCAVEPRTSMHTSPEHAQEEWDTRPSQWQPIETAPKDMTEVLGWRKDCGVMMIRWCAPIDFMTEKELMELDAECPECCEQYDWFCSDFVAGCRLDGDETPTHWMPLPEPPQ